MHFQTMDASDLTDHLSEDILSRFENGSDLDGIISGEIFQQENSLYNMGGDHEEENEPDDIIILHMDIREPLSSLKSLLEQKIDVDLKKYSFWLQDAQILEPHKNLVDQCVKGEGLVQINVQIQTTNQHINIVDVLKPTEAALAALGNQNNLSSNNNKNTKTQQFEESDSGDEVRGEHEAPNEEKQKPCLNWALDTKFKKEQARLKIPEDPNDWTVPHVKHWLQWAVRQFNLTDISRTDWNITGEQLCSLTHEEFRKKVPNDQGNVFWTHLQLLKECKFVSVVVSVVPKPEREEFSDSNSSPAHREQKIMRKNPSYQNKNVCLVNGQGGSGNNGQMQLWQFLLEILTDCEHTSIIQWVGTEGEFKLLDPECVARLWGVKKNKPAMNYEKLSRALRYYYDGDMISKVSGKRFAYKFDCDLKMLIGYNAEELSKLVNEKKYVDEFLPTNVRSDEGPSDDDVDSED